MMMAGLNKLHPENQIIRAFQVGCDFYLDHLGVCILDNTIHRARVLFISNTLHWKCLLLHLMPKLL